MFYRENHIPILSPHNVAMFKGETIELAWVKVLVILWMRMATDEVTNVHRAHGIVTERKTYGQVSHVFSLNYPSGLRLL